jgi:hypothetical protein
MEYALYFVFCAVCIGSVLYSIRIKRYIRASHPKLWTRFRFFGNGWWAPASREAQELKSDLNFWGHLATHGSELNDATLNRMLRTRRILHALGALLLIAVILTFLSLKD